MPKLPDPEAFARAGLSVEESEGMWYVRLGDRRLGSYNPGRRSVYAPGVFGVAKCLRDAVRAFRAAADGKPLPAGFLKPHGDMPTGTPRAARKKKKRAA